MSDDTTTKKPAGAKKPEDRKPKASAKATTVTYKGVTVTPLPDMADDFRLLADYGAMQDEDDGLRQTWLMRSVLHRLVGRSAGEAALAELAAETGKVSVDDAAALITAVMEAISPNS